MMGTAPVAPSSNSCFKVSSCDAQSASAMYDSNPIASQLANPSVAALLDQLVRC